MGWYDRTVRRVRDLSCGDTRIFLELEVRRVECRRCGKVKRERLEFLADNPLYTKRFAYYVGDAAGRRRSRTWRTNWLWTGTRSRRWTSNTWKRSSSALARLVRRSSASTSLRSAKVTPTGFVVSDLIRGRPIWFGGDDRSEASMSQFYAWLGSRKRSRIRLAVMDMWKPFRLATHAHAPQVAILFDKFHVMRHLGEALDQVRKNEYARLQGRGRRYIKGQKYTLLSRKENLTLEGKRR